MGKSNLEMEIITQDLDEEILQRMPDWFRIIHKAIQDRAKV